MKEGPPKSRAAALISDHRLAIGALLAWLVVLIASFIACGGTEENDLVSMGFGPSPDVQLVGIRIDSWGKWAVVIAFMVVDTVINTWASEVIGPWISNSVYDHKEKYLDYGRWTTLAIVNLFYFYHNIRYYLTSYVAFSQVDIIGAGTGTEIFVTLATSWAYIRDKRMRELSVRGYAPVRTESPIELIRMPSGPALLETEMAG